MALLLSGLFELNSSHIIFTFQVDRLRCTFVGPFYPGRLPASLDNFLCWSTGSWQGFIRIHNGLPVVCVPPLLP